MAETKTSTPASALPVEKQTNCLGCGKALRKIKSYYRNGKLYCNKKCWRNFIIKSKEEKK